MMKRQSPSRRQERSGQMGLMRGWWSLMPNPGLIPGGHPFGAQDRGPPKTRTRQVPPEYLQPGVLPFLIPLFVHVACRHPFRFRLTPSVTPTQCGQDVSISPARSNELASRLSSSLELFGSIATRPPTGRERHAFLFLRIRDTAGSVDRSPGTGGRARRDGGPTTSARHGRPVLPLLAKRPSLNGVGTSEGGKDGMLIGQPQPRSV